MSRVEFSAFLIHNLNFARLFGPSNARIFAKKAPVFRPSFYKNEPVWRVGNTEYVNFLEEGPVKKITLELQNFKQLGEEEVTLQGIFAWGILFEPALASSLNLSGCRLESTAFFILSYESQIGIGV